ncbi:MAG: response regulator [Oligoflexia bacterium]|nr:response regulator [Oligoflexia bacterium]
MNTSKKQPSQLSKTGNLDDLGDLKELIELKEEFLFHTLDDEIADIENWILSLEDTKDELEDELDGNNVSLIQERSDEKKALVNNIKRTLHSLKGRAGSTDIDFISTIAHSFEGQLVNIKNVNKIKPSQITLLLEYIDLLKESADAYRENLNFDYRKSPLLKKLLKFDPNIRLHQQKNDPSSLLHSKKLHKILIISKSKIINIFSAKHYQVVIVDSVKQAKEILYKEKVDSLITDYTLTNGDGNTLITNLKKSNTLNKNIPTILITSKKETENQAADYVLHKDTHMLTLLREIYKQITTISMDELAVQEKITKNLHRLSKIICIDDDPSILELVKIGIMKYPEIMLRVFTSSKDFFLNITDNINFVPNLILLDSIMPDVDGAATYKEIQKHGSFKNTAVIFFTAKSALDEIKELIALGAIGIVRKPFKPQNLLASICEIIDP